MSTSTISFLLITGLDSDELDILLPPTIDEMKADDENQVINKNEIVEVDIMDDDNVHLEIHNKATDTSSKYSHIRAHKRAMLLKKIQQQQQEAQAAQSGAGQEGGAPTGAQPQNDKSAVQGELLAPTIQNKKPTV